MRRLKKRDLELFNSAEPMRSARRYSRRPKLWDRQYVDGTAANISVHWGEIRLCTPTMLSKADLKEVADICLPI